MKNYLSILLLAAIFFIALNLFSPYVKLDHFASAKKMIQYKVDSKTWYKSAEEWEEKLNKYASEGWELVLESSSKGYLVFKK